MNQRLRTALSYILARLQENSTWRGLSLIVGAMGAHLEPDKAELFIFAGLMFSGLIGASFPDKKE